METYEKLVLDVVLFESNDVITSSPDRSNEISAPELENP